MQGGTAILLMSTMLTVGLSLVVGVGVVDVSAADTLVVDQDGTAEYSSIQAAIDDASAGDTVEIRPGTYAEEIAVEKNITVTAPDGATLDGTDVDSPGAGVTIGGFDSENVEPTIRGITITRFEVGINARDSVGNWVVSGVTVRIVQNDGIDIDDSSGDWTVRDSEVVSTGFDGISAAESNGEWVIEDTIIRRTQFDGVDAESTFDDWAIRNVSVEDNGLSSVGISAARSADNWIIEQSSVQGGIAAENSNGKWEITQSIITGDVPISAEDTLGEWRIRQSIINETSTSSFDEGTAVDATDAIGEGIATDNWWGSPSGPDESACVGNVDCSNPLTTPPSDVGYNPNGQDGSSTQLQVDVDASDLPGDGTESNPYKISNASELQAMEDDLTANYELVTNINASNTAQWNNRRGFDPVGEDPFDEGSSVAFSGSFDANGFTITGLTIDRSTGAIGLFGATNEEALLTDISLTGIAVTGGNNAGGVVGLNLGTIRAATTSGNVTGLGEFNTGGLVGFAGNESVIQNATASVSVTGTNATGGVAGQNRGTIQTATASGDVSGSGRFNVGGLVGFADNQSDIQNVTASGDVDGPDLVGGLVGQSRGTITNATASGDVNGVTFAGGLVGEINSNGVITNATASGDVTGGNSTGGLVGFVDETSTVQQTTASGSVSGLNAVGGLAGQNRGTIQTAEASGNVSGTGIFNVGGLVGFADINSTTQNVTASGNVNGPDLVGGLIGQHRGTIQNATASGNVIGLNETGGLVGFSDGVIANATASGNVSGSDNIGGLAGQNDGTITTAVASGSTEGESDIGGLVGANAGAVRKTIASGTVRTGEFTGGLIGVHIGTVRDSFAIGDVIGTTDAGGLVADRSRLGEQGTVQDSYWDRDATGQTTSAGSAIGLRTAEMQGQAARTNMSGFNFDNTWQTQTDPDNYPTLIALPQQTELDQPDPELIPKTAVSFENQTVVNGSTTVTVASAQFGNQSVPGEDFVVVVHETNSTGGIGTKIGESPVLEGSQTNSNITVNLSKKVAPEDDVTRLSESQELVAMLHTANTTDGDNNHGTNDLGKNPPVTDRAQVGPLGLQSIETNITGNSLNQPGEPVEITANVTNDGITDDSIQLTLIRDTEQLARSNVTVAGETTRTVSFNVTPAQTEVFSIQGPASTRSVTIDVAELSLEDATLVTQESVTTNQTVVVSATVTNTGTTAGFIPLTLTENGTVVNSTTQEVPADSTETARLQFNTSALPVGTQNLTVTSSLDNQSADVGSITVQVAAVQFTNQRVSDNSTEVTVGSVRLENESLGAEKFVIVVHETTSTGEIGRKIGESGVIAANQTSSNITVNLSKDLGPNDGVSQLSESQELVAMLHRANTTDNDSINHGTNEIGENPPITSRAQVTVGDGETGTENDGFGILAALIALTCLALLTRLRDS